MVQPHRNDRTMPSQRNIIPMDGDTKGQYDQPSTLGLRAGLVQKSLAGAQVLLYRILFVFSRARCLV